MVISGHFVYLEHLLWIYLVLFLQFTPCCLCICIFFSISSDSEIISMLPVVVEKSRPRRFMVTIKYVDNTLQYTLHILQLDSTSTVKVFSFIFFFFCFHFVHSFDRISLYISFVYCFVFLPFVVAVCEFKYRNGEALL